MPAPPIPPMSCCRSAMLAGSAPMPPPMPPIMPAAGLGAPPPCPPTAAVPTPPAPAPGPPPSAGFPPCMLRCSVCMAWSICAMACRFCGFIICASNWGLSIICCIMGFCAVICVNMGLFWRMALSISGFCDICCIICWTIGLLTIACSISGLSPPGGIPPMPPMLPIPAIGFAPPCPPPVVPPPPAPGAPACGLAMPCIICCIICCIWGLFIMAPKSMPPSIPPIPIPGIPPIPIPGAPPMPVVGAGVVVVAGAVPAAGVIVDAPPAGPSVGAAAWGAGPLTRCMVCPLSTLWSANTSLSFKIRPL
mmetsp:Transcript_25888/g.64269  ORF Transcript_25888/g.64269 Transcript_25888/m.64269 type:complete len:306 (+) Transcript_25888:1094-2011(+)